MTALVGIKSISPHLGNKSEATIMKYKRQYPNLPIQKIDNGQWASESEELSKWWKCFCTGNVDQYMPAVAPIADDQTGTPPATAEKPDIKTEESPKRKRRSSK